MFVFATCERCASRQASFLSSTFSMSVKQLGVKFWVVGPFVEEEVRHVARRRQRALGEVAVVLMRVVGVVHEDHPRLDLA